MVVPGFGWGTATHATDVGRLGWPAYALGPAAANLFCHAPALLDAAAVALLAAGRRRAGLVLGTLVMVPDLVVNACAWRAPGIEAFATAIPVQAAFLGVLLGATGLVWPKRPLASRA